MIGRVKHWEYSHVEVRSDKAIAIAMVKAERDPRAWVLESMWKESFGRDDMTPKRAKKARGKAFLCGFTPM